MHNVAQLCLAVNIIIILFMRKETRSCNRSCVKMGAKWKIFIKKQTPNDKTIIELGYRKLSCVSNSQINYLPQPSASANN